MTPKVSVIVPVYNVRPYLQECLDSLLGQTLSDIEVICVDDASTDGSIEIVEEAMAWDARVRLVRHPSNQGLSAARNTGLAEARGEWTLFIDSDDAVSRFLCENTLAAAASLNADVVFFDYIVFIDGEPLPREASAATPALADRLELLGRRAFAWAKIAKTDLLRTKSILFPVGLCFEDIPVHWRLALESDRPAYLPEALVWYRQRAGSITYRKDWTYADSILIYDIVREQLRRTGHWATHDKAFMSAEMANWANVHTHFLNHNPPLATRLCKEAVARMTPGHWSLAISGSCLPPTQRDFILAHCKPPTSAESLARLSAVIRQGARDLARRLRHLIRG